MQDLYFRLALSGLIVALAVVAWSAIRWVSLGRTGNAALKLEGYERGRPALVYFSSPHCVPCKAVQRPAVERFKEQMGSGFQVIEVDAVANPEIAERWSVFSTPTTVFVDSRGIAQAVNPGVASTQTLIKQASRTIGDGADAGVACGGVADGVLPSSKFQ
jgi:thiol-disulfide isomerase/thioredoxin